MKRSIIAMTVVFAFISTTAFSQKKGNENFAIVTFQKEFKGAENVKWSHDKDFITASFVLGNSGVIAYFDDSGELAGTARNILFNQLPLLVIKELNGSYPSASIYNITEYNTNSETFYTMTAETLTRQFKLKVFSNGDISVENKIKK